jgi:hypothetical protein
MPTSKTSTSPLCNASADQPKDDEADHVLNELDGACDREADNRLCPESRRRERPRKGDGLGPKALFRDI